MARAHGIDISHSQEFFRAEVNRDDIQFIIIRVANGVKKDRKFDQFVKEIADVPVRGAYHYFRSKHSPANRTKVFPWKDQADLFLKCVEGKGFHFYVLDFEQNMIASVGELDNIIDDDFAQGAQKWMDYVAEKSGKPMVIYTNLKWYQPWMNKWPLWTAQWAGLSRDAEPALPDGVTEWKFWQYAVPLKGREYGITDHPDNKEVDLDVYNGTLEDLRRWLKLDEEVPIDQAVENEEEEKNMGNDGSYTWKEFFNIVRKVAEAHGESWSLWFQEVNETDFIDKPELFDEPYGGKAVEEWPLSDSKDSDARRAEILERLRKIKDDNEQSTEFRFKAWPTDHKHINQRFGARPEFYKKWYPGHEGIDLHAGMHEPYYAVADGKVTRVKVKESTEGYGTFVVIDHGNGYTTLYAHARARPEPPVKEGDTVKAGDIVAYSGNTGRSSAPHLHLTMKKKGHTHPGWEAKKGYIDPGPFLVDLLRTVEPKVKACYIHESHLKMKGNNEAVTNPGGIHTNVRDRAILDEQFVIVKVPEGTLVRLLANAPENGFYKCEIIGL